MLISFTSSLLRFTTQPICVSCLPLPLLLSQHLLRAQPTGHALKRSCRLLGLRLGSTETDSAKGRGRPATVMEGTSKGGVAHKYTNRLCMEHSPYLLQHAHNPVDWYPWGEEAFQKARIEDKPIFLSVGYSTCHWCHVMEVESFENEDVAKLLNESFVAIKVDREERPDVDKVYMMYVQATQGSGGWPMSVLLTPELKPIVGGTYFPPEDYYGRPGFKSVLRKVKEVWDHKKSFVRGAGDQAIQQLGLLTTLNVSSTKIEKGFHHQAMQLCAIQLAKGYDPDHGGFGMAPKFPRPVEITTMLRRYKRLDQAGKETTANKVLDMALSTLRHMAHGGIHDHIGGGFHRYSVDEIWHVPHFEKMLYDQAQLINVYLDAFSIWKDAQFSAVARDILDYLRRDMTHLEGGIFSAEDADSAEFEGAPRKEGAFYAWTSKEIEDNLGKERAEIFMYHYYVKPNGNCDLSRMSDPHDEFEGKNVLIERQELSNTAANFGKSEEEIAEILGSCRRDLYAVRCNRPRPHLDDKVIVAWNGLAISAFARASRILRAEAKGVRGVQYHFPVTGCDPREYLIAAERAAAFIKDKLYDEKSKKLGRSFRRGPSQALGFLDDYAFLIAGLIDLYEAGGGTKWLSWAIELQASQDELFLDKPGGGYFGTPEGDTSILLRLKEDYDGAEPSGNSVAAVNLIRLSSLVAGEQKELYRQRAEHLLAVFEKRVKDTPIALPLMCCAHDLLSVPSKRQVVIIGSKHSRDFDTLVTASHLPFDLDKVIIQVDDQDMKDQEFWKTHNPSVLGMAQKNLEGKAAAFVCQNFTCHHPTSDPLTLEEILRQSSASMPMASEATGAPK